MAPSRDICPHCGSAVRLPRSAAHHRLFFAYIGECYLNWPERHPFQPDNAEHLRAWLLVQAGHRDVTAYDWDSPAAAERLADLLDAELRKDRQKGVYAWVEVVDTQVRVVRPRTIRWAELPQAAFNAVSADVFEIGQAITGIAPQAVADGHAHHTHIRSKNHAVPISDV